MTVTRLPQPGTPPALTALEPFTWLSTSVQNSIAPQAARIQERLASFAGRRATLNQITALLRALQGGVVTVEGAPGTGVTTLLAHLAATHPFAFWFSDDDAGQGAAALYAQLIALHHLSIQLIPPSLNRPTALQHLLDEAASQRPATDADATPMVVLVDAPATTLQPHEPHPPVFPTTLPPGVLVIYGCTPDTPLPFEPDARVVLPYSGDELLHDQRLALQTMGCPDEWVEPLCTCSQGNFLYLRLAHQLCRGSSSIPACDVSALQPGLEALHHLWWSHLDAPHQRLITVLAAAAAPIPTALCTELLGSDPRPLVDGVWVVENSTDETLSLYHWLTADYVAQHHAHALQQVHADMVNFALQQGIGSQTTENAQQAAAPETFSYLLRHSSRHAVLSPPDTRDSVLPLVAQRSWIHAQERYNTMADAARDLAWKLYSTTASDSTTPLLRIVRSAALAGTLFSRARTMPPDDAIAAFNAALEHMGREAALKRILALVNQLPDGRDKALVLRQLGETCFSRGSRSSSMRLLSQALDIEDQKIPPSWREQREQLHMKLVEAALALNAVEAALEISSRIGHVERRGLAEKKVVYWLREHGELTRAQEVASAIQHENLCAWTQAEVAVRMARAGDREGAERLLDMVNVETARAWAQIELACDTVAHDTNAAHAQIERLPTPNQRNHGLARLAQALGNSGKHQEAIDTAGQISNMGVHLQTLVNLVELDIERSMAIRALEQAAAGIGMLEHDVRVPLVAMLTASYTALDNAEKALSLASLSAEGEERDRAVSRVAVAMVKHGKHDQGIATARNLNDDDERDWTLDEIVRFLAEAGHWERACELTQEIRADQQRAHTLADLAIAYARSDNPTAALDLATTIAIPYERARAFRMIAPAMVAAGHTARSLALARAHLPPDQISRYLLALATALAEQGHLDQSMTITSDIPEPLNRARAYLAMAQAAAPHDSIRARTALVTALQSSILGRTEAFQLLDQSVSTLTLLGDAALLTDIAAAVDEIDTW